MSKPISPAPGGPAPATPRLDFSTFEGQKTVDNVAPPSIVINKKRVPLTYNTILDYYSNGINPLLTGADKTNKSSSELSDCVKSAGSPQNIPIPTAADKAKIAKAMEAKPCKQDTATAAIIGG
jgi:hypothetical protein